MLAKSSVTSQPGRQHGWLRLDVSSPASSHWELPYSVGMAALLRRNMH